MKEEIKKYVEVVKKQHNCMATNSINNGPISIDDVHTQFVLHNALK